MQKKSIFGSATEYQNHFWNQVVDCRRLEESIILNLAPLPVVKFTASTPSEVEVVVPFGLYREFFTAFNPIQLECQNEKVYAGVVWRHHDSDRGTHLHIVLELPQWPGGDCCAR